MLEDLLNTYFEPVPFITRKTLAVNHWLCLKSNFHIDELILMRHCKTGYQTEKKIICTLHRIYCAAEQYFPVLFFCTWFHSNQRHEIQYLT